MSLFRRLALPIAVIAALTFGAATTAFADGPQDDLAKVAVDVDAAITRLDAGDVAGAKAAYARFVEGWARVEDGVRPVSRTSYLAIEDAMSQVRVALVKPEVVDAARARAALVSLRAEIDRFVSGAYGAPAPAAPAREVTLASFLASVEAALGSVERGDMAAASSEVDSFRTQWTAVEGDVKARSADAYTQIENDMADAAAYVERGDAAKARSALERIRDRIAPFATSAATYGIFDAAIILFREGLEALLVVGALLAFLSKTGNADKGRWIWGGAGAGVALSIAVAAIVSAAFASGAGGADRELLEGLIGLAAAVMLIYVSYWLHSKSSLAAWQKYIRDKTSAALARNSLISLATVSFLAVFREGAETVLFYAGIAPQIAVADLGIGLVAGAAALAAIGVAMLAFSIRLPIRLFFSAASVLIYYLAFKFIGTGVHALQVAGVFPATPAPVPSSGFLGVFPTWETTAPQLALLLAAAAVLLIPRFVRGAHPGTGGAAPAV